jgi:transposase
VDTFWKVDTMSRMSDSRGRRRRRQFDEEFKAQAVRLVLEDGKSVGAVARDLDLTESALRQWVERARADRMGGRTGPTTAERKELLRKENRELRTERDILKKSPCLDATPTQAMKVVRPGREPPGPRSAFTGATNPEKNGPEYRPGASRTVAWLSSGEPEHAR